MVNIMAYTPAIHAIRWICVCFMIGKNQAHRVTACFRNDPPCNRFNITCDNNTIIRITGAEYRYTDSSGIPNPNCCNLNYNDCKANYSYNHAVILYSRCSGEKSCLNNLVPQPTDHACKNYTGAKYGHVTYDCIHDNETVDMCQTDVNATSEVNIILKDGNATSNPIKCSCYVEAKEKVMYQLVDVRLFTNVHGTEGKYDCVTSTFQVNNNTSIKCKNFSDNSFAYMNSSNFEEEIGHIQNFKEVLQLTYAEKQRPKMVWVNLKAQPNETFNIQCKTVPSITTTETASTERVLPSMTTSASDKTPVGETDKDKNDDGKSLPIIVGVVVAAIILIAVVSSALIILKRRQRKPREDDSPKSEAPSCLINRTSNCIDDSGKSYATVQYSTYYSINDESVATYIPPVEKMKDDRGIHEDTTTQGKEVSADEYDRIQFKKEFAKTIQNYDHFPAMGGNIRNDTYSHVSNQSEFANAATANASEYSHCKLSSKKIQRNDDDYSHVDLEGAWKKNKPPDSIEEGSYSHINFA